ncbi:MAG: cytochrome c biogenesis protein CcsA [Candidatus Omnitrophota bacterium]|nr:cytochrome c biogenesis protein CcsA [Candidatus Omnitrophota bacterium]
MRERAAQSSRAALGTACHLIVYLTFLTCLPLAPFPLPPVVAAASSAERIPPDALATLRHVAIQHAGRHKPFDSFARETLKRITGRFRFRDQDPVATVLSMAAEPERWQDEPILHVPSGPLQEALGLERGVTRVSYNSLIETRRLMRLLPPIVEKQRRDEKLSMREEETMDLYERFVSLNSVFEQRLELVPPAKGGATQSWLPILQPAGYPEGRQEVLRSAWTAFVTAVREHQPQAISASAHALADLLRSAQPAAYPAPWRLGAEVWYNRLSPFQAARMLYLLAALGLVFSLGAWRRVVLLGRTALWLALLLHGLGILTRVILGGRPPVSNFYETMLWLPFVTVALALVLERIHRARAVAPAAAVLAGAILWLADVLPLDSSIVPVVAVLRSHLWLTIHVLTIVASYGVLTLATGLAHVYGGLYVARRGGHPTLRLLDAVLYRAIQAGVVLLAAGIMLGAVWANASWGRYWGWDPKETWALITLLWFLAILHGRFAGWLHGIGVALSTIGGFLLLLMTYYGVSFYLVGLHSYAGGHATPVPPLLIAFLVAEGAFVGLVGATALSRRRHQQVTLFADAASNRVGEQRRMPR